MDPREKNNNLPLLIAGIIIGAVATYLFTNKEGQKMKDRLLKEGSKLLRNLGESLEEIEDKVREQKDEIEKKAEKKIETAKETVEEIVGEVPKHITQIQKKGRRFFFSRRHSQES